MATTGQNVACFPFTSRDLSNLLWSQYNHPQAHAAILQTENACTDAPSLRSDPRKGNAYIRQCLDAIARRREHVEEADALFDCGMSGEEALAAIPAPPTSDKAADVSPGGSGGAARKRATRADRMAGGLYAEVKS